jgi:hypothetical protein
MLTKGLLGLDTNAARLIDKLCILQGRLSRSETPRVIPSQRITSHGDGPR